MTTNQHFDDYNAQRIAAFIPDHSEPIYASHWVDCNDEIFNQSLTANILIKSSLKFMSYEQF